MKDCEVCCDNRLLDDDYWEHRWSRYDANSAVRYNAVNASPFYGQGFRSCIGCITVARRQLKVLLIVLNELGVRMKIE